MWQCVCVPARGNCGCSPVGGGACYLSGGHQHRVRLVNVHHNARLCATGDLRDTQRRNVSLEKPMTSCGDSNEDFNRKSEWRLVPSGDGTYAIIHHHYNEAIYAMDGGEFDQDRRTVLTWIPGFEQGDQQSLWELQPGPNRHFFIKNRRFGEFLQGTDYPSKDRVFTWRNTNCNPQADCKFHWDIIPLN